MRRIHAFLLGMAEFRSSFTTRLSGDLLETYDSGRDLAHRLTLRQFDEG